MIKRRPKKKSQSSHERWLITYADLITVLLIFFIIMYTLSKVDAAKFQSLAETLAQVFGAGGMVLDSPGPAVVPGEPEGIISEAIEQAQLNEVRQELEQYIQENELGARVSVTTEERGIVLSFQEDVLFELGRAELTPQAQEVISKVAPILKDSPNYIRIEGHTDNLPIRTAQFPSNWELSAARSINVVQELINNHGFVPQKLSASAYGEYRPTVPNVNDHNRQLNRRVNLVLLRSKFAEAEPPSIEDLDNLKDEVRTSVNTGG